ncbi:50S ribosomal protein L25/general stress protein Ctc [Clostridium boliviensis]|uniref:50S ribosomal protein L25/general stress protein Ctc n=1 Tax=Clostridium boliviensis TaxID=318465 RepID=A0ABU4GLG2_9CLOT|nr:50S ribosomal protein L25/general stress protein Ctc [Clostridium boliviensis]MDW2798451.1 50S ribosomal protein L25/general stress protein Ctc [Clostridium boliviensis]
MDTITVEKRNEQLKAKQLRRKGIVPCCIFGGSLPNSISIQLDEKSAEKLLRKLRLGSKIQLKLEDQTIITQIKDSRRCFADNKIEYIDFQALNPKTKVNSVAHVILENTDYVTGVLDKLLMEIPYASLPEDMIDTVTVDLEGKPVGTIITVGDIPEFLSDHIDLQVETDSIVLRIAEKRNAAAQDTEQAAE